MNIFRILWLTIIGYPLAAMLSANVSMTLSATVWTSYWTYIILLFGAFLSWGIAFSFVVVLSAIILVNETPEQRNAREIREILRKIVQ